MNPTRCAFAPLVATFLLSAALAQNEPTRDPRPPADARARELIATLNLSYLPGESGYFGFIGRADERVSVGGRTLAAQSRIYYLLTAELPLNYLHWLASEDTHILLEGGPVDYFIFHPDGRVEKSTLGRDFAAGQKLVITAPAHCGKALRLHPGAAFALMANVLSPEWTPDRVTIGAGRDFIRQYSGQAAWADAAFLEKLVGPNLQP